MHAQADIVVRVRANVRVDAHLAAGTISATNVNGDLELERASGGITVDGARSTNIDIEVASGSIRVANAQAIER